MTRKTHIESSKKFWSLLCVAVLLVVISGVATGMIFQQYSNVLIKRQDEQLHRMAQARDRSIAADFENLRKHMTYMMKRQGFLRAEDEWKERGNAQKLLLHLQDNPIAQTETIHTILAIRDGQVELSANGRTDYVFIDEPDQTLALCQDGTGKLYLAYTKSQNQMTYAALLDLDVYLQEIACVTGDADFQTMLMNESGQVLMYQGPHGNFICSAEEASQSNCDMAALALLQKSISAQQRIKSSYTLIDPVDGEEHELRFACIPASQTQNRYFAVALSNHFDAVMHPMHLAAIQLFLSSAVAAVGLLILGFLAIDLRNRNRQRTTEVEKLMEANQEISTLLEKSQQLAHHQRLETIGTLTSGIAHEFNNLLTPIMSYSVMSLEKLPEDMDEIGENIARIYDASSKAKMLVARLSELSRKGGELPMHPLPLDEAIRRITQVAATACPINVQIKMELQCTDAYINGNETQMSQLLLNLFINAFNAMKETDGLLTISSREETETLIVTVADNGFGIAPDILPRIFEPFFTTRLFENGTGLGLAIAQQVMESHQGTIEVSSTEGEGTCFTLCFPRCKRPAYADEHELS